MNIKNLVLSLAVIAVLFVSCDDSKKKEAEAEAAAQAEQLKMEEEAARQAEEQAKAQAEYDANTITAIASGNENFSTLVTAVTTANLAETLKAEGPYTVFAPTNEAFGKLKKGTLDNLLKPENQEKLKTVLTYHVVPGELKAADVIAAIQQNNNAYEIVTLQGEKLVLSLKEDKVMIKDAKGATATVVMADVDASNGVIHGVDTVLMPKA